MSVTGPPRDYSAREGREALERAFSVVMSAADESTRASAAKFLTLGRGAVARPDREYALALLDIVNYNLTESARSEALEAMRRGERDAFTSMAEDHLEWYVTRLDHIRKNPAAAARHYAKEWDRTSEGRVLSIPQFEHTTEGFRPVYRTVILKVEAAYAHVLRLLASPPLCNQLRRCELPCCGRFFLYVADRAGPPPTYCIDNDGRCSEEAKRQKALARVREFRRRKRTTARRPK